MKKVQILLSLAAFAFFVGCHNPYSSTSQEPRDESEETMEHHKAGEDHGAKGAGHETKSNEHMAGDSTHTNMMDTTVGKAAHSTAIDSAAKH